MSYFDEPYRVLVSVNESGLVTAVNSSAFVKEETGWTEIDSGHGDQYHHAQGNYFPKTLRTMGGAYRYKLVEGKAVECTAEEIAQQEEANVKPAEPSDAERITELEEALALLLSGVTE